MLAATAWDGPAGQGAEAEGWTVMGRLRERQRAIRRLAPQTATEDLASLRMMNTGLLPQDYADPLRNKLPGPTVLAFLFTYPGSQAIQILDDRGSAFDMRSGVNWDLFFPGYYRSANPKQPPPVEPVGSSFAKDWHFSPQGFEHLRSHVQDASEDRWRYSGLTDLVLVCAWVESQGEPIVDWRSTLSGSLSDDFGDRTLSLGEVVQRISDDLEANDEDPYFGVPEVVAPEHDPAPGGGATREFLIGVLSSIAASFGTGG